MPPRRSPRRSSPIRRRRGCAQARPFVSLTAMRFYLTTPIYYVNATPHIGHAYTTIAADVVVRHHRQRGDDTFFLTGTDEHASKVYRVAEEAGVDPKAYVDEIVEKYWRELPSRSTPSTTSSSARPTRATSASSRSSCSASTTTATSTRTSMRASTASAARSSRSEADLVDGLCPDHGIPPEYIEEKNYFFRLSAYQDRLLALYDERPDFVLPRFRYNEARSFIEGGLQDFSVSRAGQPWGVPIPWDEEQVTYVWVDALINYLSALSYARDGEDLREQFWPHVRHLLGKDILRFHCVFWPALLLVGRLRRAAAAVRARLPAAGRAQDLEVARQRDRSAGPRRRSTAATRSASGRSGRSRSGRTGTPRSTLCTSATSASSANDLGNLVSRTTAMIARYRDGRIAPGAARTRSSPVALDGLRANAGRALRRVGPDARARGRSGSSCAGSTATSRRRLRGSWPRTRRDAARARRGALRPRRRAARGRRRALSLPAARRRRRSSARSASPSTSRWSRSRTA